MDDAPDELRSRVGDVQVFASPRSRRRFVFHLLVVAVVLGVGVMLVRPWLGVLTDRAALRVYIAGYGIWAPLVFVVLQAAQVVFAPIPGQVLAVVAGYLFGVWWGTLYNMIGITLGSTAAFWLSRRFGRGYVERIVHEDALARFDGIDDNQARVALFVFFLIPGLPDDVICFVGGLTRLPIRQLVVIAVVGRAPAFFLVNVVGDMLGTERVEAALVLAAALVAVSAAGYLYRDEIVERFGGG